MKRFLLIMVIMAFTVNAYAVKIDTEQEKVRAVAERIGNKYCSGDMCFGKTLQAITWAESSFGKFTIGDAKEKYFYYLHNDKEIRVQESKIHKKDGKLFTWYQPIKEKYLKRVYHKVRFKPLENSSLGSFQIKLSTAKRVIKEMELKRYYRYLNDDERLVNMLLNSSSFSATIAVHYLIMNYEYAVRNGHPNPWELAVSRYNGGNNNRTYIDKIRDRIKKLPELELSWR